MQLLKPDFYDCFQCIAGACSVTCCQEWKIYVDEDTEQTWKKVAPPLTAPGHKKCLKQFVTDREGNRVIRLMENHKCPFLNKNKLCDLVTSYGDEMLSETCRTFPRELHERGTGVEQVLLLACPQVVDLLNIKKLEFILQEEKAEIEQSGLLRLRNYFMELILDSKYQVSMSLKIIFYFLQDMLKKTTGNDDDGQEWIQNYMDQYCNEKTVRELTEGLAAAGYDGMSTLEERNELFLDLGFHYREEGLYSEWLDELSEYAEEVAEDYETSNLLENDADFRIQLKNHDQLLRNVTAYWIYSDALSDCGTLQSMTVEIQWLVMKYAALEQMLFLHWMKRRHALSYETIRTYIVVISRMTGYDEDDIYEYMENSFERLIWDWGYFALVAGQ